MLHAQQGIFGVKRLTPPPAHGLGRRAQWLAVLLGPPGCFLRWYLSRFNYKLHGRWRWLPCGTLAANMAACLVDYIVGVRDPLFLSVRLSLRRLS